MNEIWAVIIGVVCGVAAGIPTSYLLLVLLTWQDRKQEEEAARQAQQGSYLSYWPAPSPGPLVSRQFYVVGGQELLVDREGV